MQRQSGNPRGTVGDGRSNNNNTKSNLNYALKRLGQNNPQNKHKRGVGEGEGARDQTQGVELHASLLCAHISIPGSGICVKMYLIFG